MLPSVSLRQARGAIVIQGFSDHKIVYEYSFMMLYFAFWSQYFLLMGHRHRRCDDRLLRGRRS
jgi:hypothetical protein